MKAEDLRIGNIVQYPHIENNKTVMSGVVCQIGLSLCKAKYSISLEHDSFTPIDLTSIKPIPLTEEWLLKFGFVCKNVGYLCDNFYIDDDFYICVLRFNCEDYIKVSSVHQLQNIYFTLTGKELEIK